MNRLDETVQIIVFSQVTEGFAKSDARNDIERPILHTGSEVYRSKFGCCRYIIPLDQIDERTNLAVDLGVEVFVLLQRVLPRHQ